MASFVLSLIAGMFQIGSATHRTLSVYEGQYHHAWIASVIGSFTYFVGTLLIVQGDLVNYIGFSLGAAIITLWMAWKNGKAINRKFPESPSSNDQSSCCHDGVNLSCSSQSNVTTGN